MKHFSPEIKQDPLGINHAQYARDVVLASVRRRFNVMDVVWMSKRCRVLTGMEQKVLTVKYLTRFQERSTTFHVSNIIYLFIFWQK